MHAARAANDVLRFLLELLALAGLALWGSFVAPKAQRHPGDPWRLLLEAVVFGAGALAFAGAGLEGVAVALGVLSALHLAATFPLGQRRPWAA